MKRIKSTVKQIVLSSVFVVLLFCSCHQSKTDTNQPSKITAEMAYEGVNNYCHSEYDWSIAKENPSIMYVTMGEETESEYKVGFRSYTGAFVYFDVDSVAGTINLFDYLDKDRPEKEDN